MMKPELLFAPPFTDFHDSGIAGILGNDANRVIGVINQIKSPPNSARCPGAIKGGDSNFESVRLSKKWSFYGGLGKRLSYWLAHEKNHLLKVAHFRFASREKFFLDDLVNWI